MFHDTTDLNIYLNKTETIGHHPVDVSHYYGYCNIFTNKTFVFKWITYCQISVNRVKDGSNGIKDKHFLSTKGEPEMAKSGETNFSNRETIGGIVLLNETARIPYVPY